MDTTYKTVFISTVNKLIIREEVDLIVSKIVTAHIKTANMITIFSNQFITNEVLDNKTTAIENVTARAADLNHDTILCVRRNRIQIYIDTRSSCTALEKVTT